MARLARPRLFTVTNTPASIGQSSGDTANGVIIINPSTALGGIIIGGPDIQNTDPIILEIGTQFDWNVDLRESFSVADIWVASQAGSWDITILEVE